MALNSLKEIDPYNQFVHCRLKHLFTFFAWCLVLISSLVFPDWQSIAITGSLNLLPYVLAVSLMMWPWTSVVISGVIFTIDVGKSQGVPIGTVKTSISMNKHKKDVMMLEELPTEKNSDNYVMSQFPSKVAMEGVYPQTSECGSWIFIFVSALLLWHLTVTFVSNFLSWNDVLVTGFQYRSFIYIFIMLVLSVLLAAVFLGLSLEWLRASIDQQLHPCDHVVVGNEAIHEYSVPNQILDYEMEEIPSYAEVFVQSVDETVLGQKEEDKRDLTSIRSCDGVEQMDLEELLHDLNEVINWFSFGINLEIPEARLKEIEQKYESIGSCKREMLTVWMQLTYPTWKAVVIALAGIDMKDLALKIAIKHGVSFPPSLRDIIHQLEHTNPDSEQLTSFDLDPLFIDCDVDSSSISSQDIQASLPPPNEPKVFEVATNDTKQVSEISNVLETATNDTKQINEISNVFKTATNDTEQVSEISDVFESATNDTGQVSEISDVFKTATNDTEQVSEISDVFESATNDTEQVSEISDVFESATNDTEPVSEACNVFETSTNDTKHVNETSNVFESATNDTEQVSDISDDKTQPLLNLPSPSYDDVHEMVEWIPDSEAKKCFYCQARFTAIRRRHHCRSCGQVFCNTCSKQKIILVHLGSLKRERVCDECYRKHESGEVFNSVREQEEDEYIVLT